MYSSGVISCQTVRGAVCTKKCLQSVTRSHTYQSTISPHFLRRIRAGRVPDPLEVVQHFAAVIIITHFCALVKPFLNFRSGSSAHRARLRRSERRAPRSRAAALACAAAAAAVSVSRSNCPPRSRRPLWACCAPLLPPCAGSSTAAAGLDPERLEAVPECCRVSDPAHRARLRRSERRRHRIRFTPLRRSRAGSSAPFRPDLLRPAAPISCGRVGIGSRAHRARRPRSERRALELLRPDPCRLPSLWIPPSASKLSRSAARHRIQYARRALLYPVQDPRPGISFSRSASGMLLLLLLWPFAFRCCSALSLSRCIQSRKVS